MSGPEFLFDTNIVIGQLKGTPAARDLIAAHGAVPSTTAVSQITRMELLGFPAITENEEAVVLGFLKAIRSSCSMRESRPPRSVYAAGRS